ncbi:sulfite exporter TauE/SafE family protein [Clostridium sp. Mt-5]|uniref:Probable membrane transporter protein n=1 Tax=Clostridium moutaii TaxID=3240932 RepID=A0ABV4BTB1_9CLOT
MTYTTGAITGGMTSLIGASGVMIIVPILTMFFKVNVHTAIGTSLFVDVIASLTVSYSYYKNDNIDLKSGTWIALTSVIGAQLGALFANRMKEGKLSFSFGIFLVIGGLSMFYNSFKERNDLSDTARGLIHFKKEWQKISAVLITGLGIGILSGLFGAGGGVMVLIALIILMSFPLHKAIGTSTLIMSITAFSSAAGYAARDNINLKLGSFLAVGAVLSGILGSRYANKINEKTLRSVVGICFMAMGIAMTVLAIIE